MQKTRRPYEGLLLVPLILVAVFSFLSPYIPIARAAIAVDGNCSAGVQSGSTVSCTLTTASTPDVIIIIVYIQNVYGGAVCPGSGERTVSSISGDGLTWTKRTSQAWSAHCYDLEEWYAITSGTVSGSITVTLSGSLIVFNGNWAGMVAYGVSGAATAGQLFDSNVNLPNLNYANINDGSSISGSVSTTYTNDMIIAACSLLGEANTIPTVQSPLGSIKSQQNPNANHNGAMGTGDVIVSSAQSGTTYSCKNTGSPPGSGSMILILDAIEQSPGESSTPVIVVGPCTFFELQCWWYPFFFMGLYSGFLLMVSTALKTSSRGKTHIFLSAVTMGSLIAVILGIMNIVFPLLMLLLNTLIVLRTR